MFLPLARVEDDGAWSLGDGERRAVRAVDVHAEDAVDARVGPVDLLPDPVVRDAVRTVDLVRKVAGCKKRRTSENATIAKVNFRSSRRPDADETRNKKQSLTGVAVVSEVHDRRLSCRDVTQLPTSNL